MRRRILSYILLLGMVSAFLGCGGTNKGARVIDVPRPPSYEYWVKSGDTLYSIAWRHEMDFTELARINNIAHPYRIFPDQRLKVSNPPLNAQASDEPGATTSRRSTTAATPPPAVAKPPANLPDKQPVAKQPVAKPAAVPAEPSRRAAPARWSWPSEGKISKAFGANNKGVNFQLQSGSEIHAAGSGTVVYAGSGLGGYRSLIIIRHNERYLSAYSLDQGVLVAEGQKVSSGDVIARVAGNVGRDMHFEVRIEGKPIDPMQVLRARS